MNPCHITKTMFMNPGNNTKKKSMNLGHDIKNNYNKFENNYIVTGSMKLMTLVTGSMKLMTLVHVHVYNIYLFLPMFN